MTILFTVILLIELLFSQFYPGWTFTRASFVIANNIIQYLAFFGVIFCVVFTFKRKSVITTATGVIALFLFSLLTFSEIIPIDTTTKPVDIKTISEMADGTKIVVRQYKNAKTNEEIIDTVKVRDIYIFRRFFKSEKIK